MVDAVNRTFARIQRTEEEQMFFELNEIIGDPYSTYVFLHFFCQSLFFLKEN